MFPRWITRSLAGKHYEKILHACRFPAMYKSWFTEKSFGPEILIRRIFDNTPSFPGFLLRFFTMRVEVLLFIRKF
jgi:hypothetical protein